MLKFIILYVKGIVNRTWALGARRLDFGLGIALGLAFALYLRTMPPTVLDGDSGEFQYMAHILGVPHSTGYPLYILLAKSFTLLPIGDVAYRVTLFSVVCGALTAPIVYATARRLVRRRAPAFLAAMLLAVTPSMWGGATNAETYALHLLLGVLTVFFAVRWHQEHQPRDFCALALVFGLGLAHHRLIVFLAPALALVVWFSRAQQSRSLIARGGVLVLLPLVLYAYIPLRAAMLIAEQDPANWEFYTREDAMLKGTVSAYYNHTPEGVFNLITGFHDRSKLGFKSPLDEANRLTLATTLLWQQFGAAGIALACAGAIESFRRDRAQFAIIFAIAVGIGFIAIYLRGASTVYYFSLCYFALALWIGFGMDALLRWAERVRRATTSRAVAALASSRVIIALLALLPLSALAANFASLDRSEYTAARTYAQTVLRDHLAPNAVVIAPWEVSQPIRYLQFVENQRADLLVVNASPIWPQFDRMLTRARELRRPFYNVEFKPEFRETPGPRTVQAVPLPLPAEPQPRYALDDARIVPEVQIVGYDLEPDPPLPGEPARALIYYRTLARMYPMYSAMLTLTDLTGKTWVESKGFPASFYYPTYRWQAGDFYRDAWAFHLPTDAPAGLYHLDLVWYMYDLETRRVDETREYRVSLGTLRVGDLRATNIAHAQTARVGDAITFLGWTSDARVVTRGQSFNLDLFWRAEGAITESYTVFAHLIDASGRVVADADSPPWRGAFPTERWSVGEALRDRHTFQVPVDLAPGDYAIEIGMYLPATNTRLPIETPSGRADKIVLMQVSVR